MGRISGNWSQAQVFKAQLTNAKSPKKCPDSWVHYIPLLLTEAGLQKM